MNNFKFLPTDAERKPRLKFDNALPYEEVKNEQHVGIVIPKGYVVLDIDDPAHAEILVKILQHEECETFNYKTRSGGRHFWFKDEMFAITMKTGKQASSVGIDIEFKPAVKTMVHLCYNGEWYFTEEELNNIPQQCEELPDWIRPIHSNEKLVGLKDGDGRYDSLFKCIIPILKAGLNKDDIFKVFRLINEYVFDEPAKDFEEKALSGNKIFEEQEKYIEEQIKRKDFDQVTADWFITRYAITKYNGKLWMWQGGRFIEVKDILEKALIEKHTWLNKSMRSEIIERIRLFCRVITTDATTIQFRNGYLINGKFNVQKPSKMLFTPYYIDHNVEFHNEHNELLDYYFNSIANGDEELEDYFIDIITYLLDLRRNEEIAFICTGSGKNGKSTFSNLLNNMMGFDNVGNLSLESITGDKYALGTLVDKFVNIANEIDIHHVKTDGIFKQLVSWEPMTVDQKYKDMQRVKPQIKLVFTGNSIPTFKDKSNGVLRRLVLVPFNANFLKNPNPQYADIKKRLENPTVISHLLAHAIANMKNYNIMKYPQVIRSEIREFELSNNSFEAFIDSNFYTDDGNTFETQLKDVSVSDLYNNYKLYCDEEGTPARGKREIDADMKRKGFKKKRKAIQNNGKTSKPYFWVSEN